uniref:uncharacterized protein LOC113474285 n=1 Tax=Ciona intestinalis TaxID=7719 RepID=UPI000EF482CA|nr:uncharacterized protein LOC113474285 [Ciona intestinalis]|eukprot:XP_026690525.1 uncharacterized protein LOC113474285 [Ciona intestinalis]
MTAHYYVGDSFEEVFSTLQIHNLNNDCTHCTKSGMTYEEGKRHFEQHYKYSLPFQIEAKRVRLFPCRKTCFTRTSLSEINRNHYHCVICLKVYGRKQSFLSHLKNHQKLPVLESAEKRAELNKEPATVSNKQDISSDTSNNQT